MLLYFCHCFYVVVAVSVVFWEKRSGMGWGGVGGVPCIPIYKELNEISF